MYIYIYIYIYIYNIYIYIYCIYTDFNYDFHGDQYTPPPPLNPNCSFNLT